MSNFIERFSSRLEPGTQFWWYFVLATVSWYSWLLIFKKSYKKSLALPLPPGPPAVPLLGNLLSLQQPLLPYFSKLSQTYGPIFKLKLGSKICIVISSSHLAKAILKEQDAIFANHDVAAAALALSYGGMDILSSPNGPYWRKLRRIFAREMMSRETLDACYELRRVKVREMVNNTHTKLGSPVNLTEQVFIMSVNVIRSMLWGEKSTTGSEFKVMVREMIDLIATPSMSEFFPLLARFDFQGVDSKTKKLSSFFDKIFESVIADRISKHGVKEETKDLLDILLEMNRRENDKTLCLSIQEIKVLFMDMIFAGTETTSNTVEWAMAEMLRHPEKMRKATKEVDEVVGAENIVEESDLSKLIYLDALIKETLRLYPSAPLLVPRKPSISCCVAGYTIPEDSRTFVNVWALHRDPEVWERAHEFEPERFLKGNFCGNNDFNYFPFGYGRRICAGIPLAERMNKYVLATLLHSFDWKIPDEMELDMSGKLDLVTKKTVPLIAIPTARLHIDRYL